MKVKRRDGSQDNLSKDAYNRIKSIAYQRGAFGVETPESSFVYEIEAESYAQGREDAARIKEV